MTDGIVHVCRAVTKKCFALHWSYGEICVECGCCSDDKRTRLEARLKYIKCLLKECKEFRYCDEPDLRKAQKMNNAVAIVAYTKAIAKIKKELARMKAKKTTRRK